MLGKNVTPEDIGNFRKLLATATEKRRHIRIIGVGEKEVGKTTLCRRLLKDDKKVEKTEGIDAYIYTDFIRDQNAEVTKLQGM